MIIKGIGITIKAVIATIFRKLASQDNKTQRKSRPHPKLIEPSTLKRFMEVLPRKLLLCYYTAVLLYLALLFVRIRITATHIVLFITLKGGG